MSVKSNYHHGTPLRQVDIDMAMEKSKKNRVFTGKSLRELRSFLGISQRDLARAAKVSQGHISEIETGQVPFDPKLHGFLMVLRDRIEKVISQSAISHLEESVKDIPTRLELMIDQAIAEDTLSKGRSICIESVPLRICTEEELKKESWYCGTIRIPARDIIRAFNTNELREKLCKAKEIVKRERLVAINSDGSIYLKVMLRKKELSEKGRDFISSLLSKDI